MALLDRKIKTVITLTVGPRTISISDLAPIELGGIKSRWAADIELALVHQAESFAKLLAERLKDG